MMKNVENLKMEKRIIYYKEFLPTIEENKTILVFVHIDR